MIGTTDIMKTRSCCRRPSCIVPADDLLIPACITTTIRTYMTSWRPVDVDDIIEGCPRRMKRKNKIYQWERRPSHSQSHAVMSHHFLGLISALPPPAQRQTTDTIVSMVSSSYSRTHAVSKYKASNVATTSRTCVTLRLSVPHLQSVKNILNGSYIQSAGNSLYVRTVYTVLSSNPNDRFGAKAFLERAFEGHMSNVLPKLCQVYTEDLQKAAEIWLPFMKSLCSELWVSLSFCNEPIFLEFDCDLPEMIEPLLLIIKFNVTSLTPGT